MTLGVLSAGKSAAAAAGPAAASGQGDEVSLDRRVMARIALVLALALVGASLLLMSPVAGRSYPGALPWQPSSLLRPITVLLSLGGVVETERGVEIKDFAFHLASVLGLGLLAFEVFRRPPRLAPAGEPKGGYRVSMVATAKIMLGAWVLLSLTSTLWSSDPKLAWGQAALYALAVAWAIALAATFEPRHLRTFLSGVLWLGVVTAVISVWYYYERNPQHRPGFPVGNPTTLAAATLPAIFVAVGLLAEHASRLLRERRVVVTWRAVAALIALVPLLWCQRLAAGRGAQLALALGLLMMVVFVSRRVGRWIIGGLIAAVILAAGAWWFSTSRVDVAMARGATIRFRLYAWTYAAQLWGTQPMGGHGAGAYPRLAGALALRDRTLDPAAFMAELVEHAHNELFEVLTEIGMVGGVTFVGGWLATVFAALTLLRGSGQRPERWLYLALAASVLGLLVDGLTGVALRLPGVPAILYTLLGVLWAASAPAAGQSLVVPVEGQEEKPGPAAAPDGHEARQSLALARRILSLGGAAVCLAAMIATGVVSWNNWRGVLAERAAYAAFERGELEQALGETTAARADLLDPVRALAARDLALACRLTLAERAASLVLASTTTQPDDPLRQEAIRRAQEAWEEARALNARVPAITQTDAAAATAAELLAELWKGVEPERATAWWTRAEQAWRKQRARTPYDVRTLLALTRYGASLDGHVALLRDALRMGEADEVWLSALARLGQLPGFEHALDRFAAVAGPITAQTDVDALAASMAPETERLLAAWAALHGDYQTAAARAGRAASMYERLRLRFPEHYSRCLAEQAQYVIRANFAHATRAVELLQDAIRSLPVIQAQKYEQMTRPYRQRLAYYQLASGQEAAARETLARLVSEPDELDTAVADAYVTLAASFLRRPVQIAPAETRPSAGRPMPPIADWLAAALRLVPRHAGAWSWRAWLAAAQGEPGQAEQVLRQAAAAGVTAETIDRIRQSLRLEFPEREEEPAGGKVPSS